VVLDSSIVLDFASIHPTPTSRSTMPMPSKIDLPDLLSICPIKGSTSPHYEAAAAESRAWVNGFNIFHGEKLAFFLTGSNELLVSHTYPYAEYEQFRTACDFVNLLFVVDEVSDDQNGKDARQTGMVYLNVMRDPAWDDGSRLAQMTRECAPSIPFHTNHIGPNLTRASQVQGSLHAHGRSELSEALLRALRGLH